MLSRRLITTLVFVPPFLLGLFTDTPGNLVLAIMGAGCAIWGLAEFYKLTAHLGAKPPRTWLYIVALGGPFVIYSNYRFGLDLKWMLGWVGLALIGIIGFMVKNGIIDRSWETFLASITSVVYILTPLWLIQIFKLADHGVWFIVFAFFNTWLADTGAYFGGKQFGKHKMSPTISPGKTWEGFASGILLSVIGVLAVGAIQHAMVSPESSARFFWTEGSNVDILRLAILAFGMVLTANLGDLTESMLKRDLGVKDSGSSLTGHGGFLDIMDSLLINIPLLFIWGLLFEGLGLS
ncbi:MAG: CDP-archaeol synthase [Candidatus Omnitrophica bacterium]|nr:CDP-archaeol synthase [Candidatus Omnitrophota bacterium]